MRYKEFSEDVYVPPDNIDSMDYPELKQELERIKKIPKEDESPESFAASEKVRTRISDLRAQQAKTPIKGPVTDKYVNPSLHDVDQEELGDNLIKIANYLFDNCKPYLEQTNYNVSNNVLFRGMATNHDAMFNIHRVRLDNRQPESTSIKDHNALNNYFTQKFGEPFRNAMFATSSLSEAMGFTNGHGFFPRAVFPIGDFTFIWSPEVRDLYTDVLLKKEVSLEKKLPTLGYQNTDLMKAIESKNEVMIRCKTYCSVHMDLRSRLQLFIDDIRSGQ